MLQLFWRPFLRPVFTLPMQVYLVLALCYFTLCFGLSRLAHGLERRLSGRGITAPLHEDGHA